MRRADKQADRTAPPSAGEVLDQTADQLDRLDDRLSEARVRVASHRGVVEVVYDGHGDIVRIAMKSGANRQYAADTMSHHMTEALRTADRTLDALHQHAFSDVKIGNDTISGWRKNPDTGADTVTACFGATSGAPS
ncbi:YbaB/EbfC family nucleoid-associated protein [Stackebrandtia soli]|uniref:YbaB/EbfC family nucleoid-associated protein n=1 Tax=Stackebrandtia soli TaxID=1892856 RepID=UPI0039E75B67